MESNQLKLQTVMDLVPMEAGVVECFLKEMSSFVHFYGK